MASDGKRFGSVVDVKNGIGLEDNHFFETEIYAFVAS